jgi:hypothetical protein
MKQNQMGKYERKKEVEEINFETEMEVSKQQYIFLKILLIYIDFLLALYKENQHCDNISLDNLKKKLYKNKNDSSNSNMDHDIRTETPAGTAEGTAPATVV